VIECGMRNEKEKFLFIPQSAIRNQKSATLTDRYFLGFWRKS
jgi:hypothetical protein